jgi:hypothetical protein
MGLTEYFAKTGYQCVYHIGDRVRGRWNGIPITGTVGNDRLISLAQGPEITLCLDLPVLFENQWHRFIVVRHNDVEPLKSS